MSGAEAIAVLGVISSIISIVDGTKQVYSAASNAKGLPEAFIEVATRLPIVQSILELAKRHIEEQKDDVDFCKRARDVVQSCKIKTQKLDKLFQKVIPADGASRPEKYLAAVKTLGKGSRVETLMKGILEDVQLLAISNNLVRETDRQSQELAAAIKEVEALSPSLPDNATDETGFTAIHSGSGGIYQSQGDQFNNPGSGHVYHAQTMNFGSTEDKEQACLRALFRSLRTDPRDDRNNLIHRKGARVDGTCTWITSNETYQKWLQSNSELLWISGGPGKGKTMLSIFLAQELESHSKIMPDTLFLEFFCDNKDEKRRSADCVIRGLLYQLLQIRRTMFSHILPTFEVQQDHLFSSTSSSSLWKVFQEMVCDTSLGPVYCILDGLDECDEASLEVILRRFKDLFAATSSVALQCYLKPIVGFPRVRLDPDVSNEVSQDIHHFIDVKVADLALHRDYPERLKVKVKAVFLDRAQGTFLWVGMAAEMLKNLRMTEVESALELCPSNLEELYARMLFQIPIRQRESAAKIMRWVVMAVRPLTLSELSEVIKPTTKIAKEFNREHIMRDQISSCGYILTVKDREVHLIHQSAKDYLLRKDRDPDPDLEAFRVQKYHANHEIANYCFNYLQNSPLADRKVELSKDVAALENYPMLSYAIEHWCIHSICLDPSDGIFDFSHPFYKRKSSLRESWLKSYPFHSYSIDTPESLRLLHIASLFGIKPLVTKLLDRKGLFHRIIRSQYINQKDSLGQTALHLAVRGEEELIVRLLLKAGADIKARDDEGHSALHNAVLSESEMMVKLLLEKGADVKAKSEHRWTALHFAVLSDSVTTIKLLLQSGANIEANDDQGWTPLLHATYHGKRSNMMLLLKKGADIEAKDHNGRTAFYLAASENREASMRLLIKSKANLETKNKDGWTTLHIAAGFASEAVVKLVLESGANIEAKEKFGMTALYLAIWRQNEAVVKLLLERGANPYTKDNAGNTVLVCARERGNETVMQLLKAYGASFQES